MYFSKDKFLIKRLYFLPVILFLSGHVYALSTPQYSFHYYNDTASDYSGLDVGDLVSGELYLINRDADRTINLLMVSQLFGYSDLVTFSQSTFELEPFDEETLTFSFNIPDGVCENDYQEYLGAKLISFEDESGLSTSGVNLIPEVRLKLNLSVESGITCASERVVFYDKDGDQVYEPANGEKPLNMGTVKIYDAADDSLLLSTNLAESNGQYEQPTGSFSGVKDVYFVVETDSVTDGVADLVEGNLYVDRRGSSSAFQNVHRVNGISSYADLSGNVDVRSRNTDQVGTWTGGDVSIGPDDKDQIISPLHWDNLVSGSDYPYADLDHDGRIDPDDKDHVISPLYWDFPN